MSGLATKPNVPTWLQERERRKLYMTVVIKSKVMMKYSLQKMDLDLISTCRKYKINVVL